MLILILAANTSFADFPRLASFQAKDDFMPRPLTTRGHRLVYSNGIVALAVAATVLVVAFGADVHRLIPLYAIGVFTSFTLSQAGMAKRHLRLREPGWRHGIAINGLGALTTAVVAIVIAITKFADGAWAIMLFVPTGVWLLVRLNRQYEEEHAKLEEGLPAFEREQPWRPIVVVLVEDVDRKTLHALQYAKTIGASETHAIHVPSSDESADGLAERWAALGLDVQLRLLLHHGEQADTVAGYAAALAVGADVTVVVPSPARTTWLERLRRGRSGARLARALAPHPNVRVTLVRDHPRPGHTVAVRDDGAGRVRLAPREGHRVVVLVDRLDRAVLRAVRYSLALNARDVRAIHAVVDPAVQVELIERWMDLRLPIELDLVECWDRDVARALEHEVAEMTGPRSEVTIVLPRRDYATLRQRVLHDRTSRRIARTLGRYEHVDIAVVPYFFPKRRRNRPPDRGPGGPAAEGAAR
jgi:hypothetical protein